jgi:uncharacterized protein (TIGR02145 family)
MRKKFLNMGGTLLAAMLLTNCNSDETAFDNSIPEPESGNLTFVLPIGKKSSVTYATVTGIDAEYTIDNLFIYWFKQDDRSYKLYKIFKYGTGSGDNITLSNQLTAANNSAMATVAVGDDHTPSRFYFITNVNLSGGKIASTGMSGLQPGITTESDFIALHGSMVEKTPAGQTPELEPITTPLPMSINKSQSGLNGGYVSVSDPATGGLVSTEVHLKRRVARFDIINNKDYSNFEVTRVLISRLQVNGIIADDQFDFGKPYASAIGDIVLNVAGGNGTRGSSADANNDGIPDDFQGANPTRDSLELNPALFYLWPTVMKKNRGIDPTDGAVLLVEGIFNGGISRLYRIDLSSDQNIEANKIYRIKVGRVTENTLKFNLIVDHWDSADTLSTTPTDASIDWGSCTFNVSTGDPASFSNLSNTQMLYSYNSDDTVVVELSVKSKSLTAGASKNAAQVEILPVAGYSYLPNDLIATQNHIETKTQTTYATQFQTDYTIKLPPTDAPLTTKLVITNPADDSDFRQIMLETKNYAKTGFKSYLNSSDGIKTYWAPLNVGATTPSLDHLLPSYSVSDAIAGKHFQWGRNNGWYPSENPTVYLGPITTAEIAANADKFIENDISWLNPWDVSLWGGANSQGPCPNGWRLPTEAEASAIISSSTVSSHGHLYKFENNEIVFCLQGIGTRKGFAGTSHAPMNVGTKCDYWTSVSLPDKTCKTLKFNYSNVIKIDSIPNTMAAPIRCVRSGN